MKIPYYLLPAIPMVPKVNKITIIQSPSDFLIYKLHNITALIFAKFKLIYKYIYLSK